MGESLGRCQFCYVHDESSRRGRWSGDPCDHWGLPRCGAIATGTTALPLRAAIAKTCSLRFLNATLTGPRVVALPLSFATVVHRSLPWLVLAHLTAVPRWVAIAAIFIAMDGCNWFAHLANHRVRMLWRFHELHHSQEDRSVLTVFRTHPFIHVSYLIALLPGIVLVANGALPAMLFVDMRASS
jgi:sterol desaturase/sphingolipid hydroxylase (fatty acid hydroxylase superfamily)